MRGISLPINAIIIIALGLLVLVIGATIIIRGGGGFARTTTSQAEIQECQTMKSQIEMLASTYDGSCDSFKNAYSEQISKYCNKCSNILGSSFNVTLMNGDSCLISC